MKPRERIEVANELGECVLWDKIAGAVWWTDIEGRALYRLDWQTRSRAIFPTPHRLASFGFIAGRRDLIVAFDCGVALFDPATAATCGLIRPEGLSSGQRMNDGRIDRQGRFWIGSMAEDPQAPSEARLYCVANGQVETHLRGLGIANGLAWSPDGTVCYVADSRERVIWRFDFNIATGALSGRREFARCRRCPDGATVDAEGYLWSAQWGGGCVIRYAPDGCVDRVLEVPVSQPSCVAFGGPDLDLLFVTTARDGLTGAETGAGDLFVYNVGVRGLEESRFQIGAWPTTRSEG
jgi:L-arabinonolactonase